MEASANEDSASIARLPASAPQQAMELRAVGDVEEGSQAQEEVQGTNRSGVRQLGALLRKNAKLKVQTIVTMTRSMADLVPSGARAPRHVLRDPTTYCAHVHRGTWVRRTPASCHRCDRVRLAVRWSWSEVEVIPAMNYASMNVSEPACEFFCNTNALNLSASLVSTPHLTAVNGGEGAH